MNLVLFLFLHFMQLYPTFVNNIMQSKSSYGKNVDHCSPGEVPIYNRRKIDQIITNASSRLQMDDFQPHSKGSSGYHVSDCFL